jgi:tetratricopeptide (TPR) repeat protein
LKNEKARFIVHNHLESFRLIMVDEDLGDAIKKFQENQETEAIKWKNKGNDFFKNGDYENAIQSYKNALDIDPNYSDAWNNLGLVYIKIGKIDEAKKCQESMKLLKTTQIVKPLSKDIQKPNQSSVSKKSTISIPTDVSLTEDEDPIWSGHMSWAANWVWFLLAILLCWTIIFPFIFVIIAWINVSTSEYFISNRRVYLKYGLIRRTVNDLKLEWITNISVTQGFAGRILNFGNVIIATPGTYSGTSPFLGVSDPMKVRGILDTQAQKYKKIGI